MSLRRRVSLALVAVIALSPALVAVESASAANVAPFVGISLYQDSYIDRTLGAMTVGVPYSDSIERGPGYDDWDILGTMPAGITFTIQGEKVLFSGTPTRAGDATLAPWSYGDRNDADPFNDDNDQMVFYVTVDDAPPAQLRGLIDVGPGNASPLIAPGASFNTWFAYINDSTTAAALNPKLVISVSEGATLSGDAHGSWVCTMAANVATCTLPAGSTVGPGDTNTPFTAAITLAPGYAKSTFTITNTASATNSSAAAYTETVAVDLPNTVVVVPSSAAYSNTTLIGYAPHGATSGQMTFSLTNGAVDADYYATVNANGVATYTGAISSSFSGTDVSATAIFIPPVGLWSYSAPSPSFYVYSQLNMAGNFYLNGALYTDRVDLYVYSDYYFDGSVGVFDQFWYLEGGAYNVIPAGPLTYSYYAWAYLPGLGNLKSYYNSAGVYQPDENLHTTLNKSTFTNDLNFYWETAPTFTDSTIAAPRQNVAYTDAVVATSNVDVDYVVSGGALPTGLSLDEETGVITGTATVLGQAYSLQIKASNGYLTSFVDLSGTVLDEHIIPTWVDDELGDFRFSTTVVDGVSAAGDGPITYEVSHGALPSGVTLNASTGQLGGAPTALGENYEFELNAYSDYGQVTAWFEGAVLPATALPEWTDTELGELRVGDTLTDGVFATAEPVASYYSLNLPSWVTLNAATGGIQATPTAAGLYDFTITAVNSVGTVDQRFTGTVEAAWIPPTFTDTTILRPQGGVYLDDQVLATGDGPITYSVPLGELPAWMTLNAANGLLSGTPPLSAVGDAYSFTVTASGHGTDTVTVSGSVGAAPWGAIEPAFVVGDVAAGAEFDYGVSGAGDTVPFSVTVNSTPVIVASGSTSALGSASGLAALPLGIAPGAHSIVLLTYASDGTPRTTTLWFTVLPNGRIGAISLTGPFSITAAALAGTGVDIGAPLGAAVLLVLLGTVFIVRRRQNA